MCFARLAWLRDCLGIGSPGPVRGDPVANCLQFGLCRNFPRRAILENAETELVPGNVVIQRGTNHAGTAIDGTALFLAIMVDRHRV
ncbi:hypothetical protein RM96_26975 [Cupriavidus sp. IDO]|nr:hypothetical protein RM96_26975 [Cupriavidus sp. IDO]